MKILLTVIVVLAVLVCVYFAYLSMNEKSPDTSLTDGKLRACPNTPNCVSSETTGEKFIEPLKPADSGQLEDLWEKSIKSLSDMGGKVEKQDDGFVWATFQSKLFKFTDDVEIRKDTEAGVIQIRSSSRSGKSDLGVNRKRVEALRALVN